jgi:hypothetical protein
MCSKLRISLNQNLKIFRSLYTAQCPGRFKFKTKLSCPESPFPSILDCSSNNCKEESTHMPKISKLTMPLPEAYGKDGGARRKGSYCTIAQA